MSIIQALSQKKKGLTRNELLKATGLKSSQGTTRKLEELENCDFIRIYTAYGNRKGTLYQLIDPFVLFYYHLVGQRLSYNLLTANTQSWQHLSRMPKARPKVACP